MESSLLALRAAQTFHKALYFNGGGGGGGEGDGGKEEEEDGRKTRSMGEDDIARKKDE